MRPAAAGLAEYSVTSDSQLGGSSAEPPGHYGDWPLNSPPVTVRRRIKSITPGNIFVGFTGIGLFLSLSFSGMNRGGFPKVRIIFFQSDSTAAITQQKSVGATGMELATVINVPIV